MIEEKASTSKCDGARLSETTGSGYPWVEPRFATRQPRLLLGALAAAIAHPQPKAMLGQSICHAFVIGMFVLVIWVNRRAARCLQKQIDELQGLKEGN